MKSSPLLRVACNDWRMAPADCQHRRALRFVLVEPEVDLMGVGPVALKLYETMQDRGWIFQGMRVLDLGSQDYVPGVYRGPLWRLMEHEPQQTVRRLCELLGAREYACIDLDGKHRATRQDLNNSASLYAHWDLVTNHGTSEHVFNQAAVFETVHNTCAVGGFMVHVLPANDYPSHGFYKYDARLFETLAKANWYKVCYLEHERDQFGALIVVVLQRMFSAPFAIPYQTDYPSPMLSRRDRLLRDLRSVG